jgi:hypothetical protein
MANYLKTYIAKNIRFQNKLVQNAFGLSENVSSLAENVNLGDAGSRPGAGSRKKTGTRFRRQVWQIRVICGF